MKSPNESSYRSASTRSRIERACGRSYSRELALISLLFMVFRGEGTSLWSDVLGIWRIWRQSPVANFQYPNSVRGDLVRARRDRFDTSTVWWKADIMVEITACGLARGRDCQGAKRFNEEGGTGRSD